MQLNPFVEGRLNNDELRGHQRLRSVRGHTGLSAKVWTRNYWRLQASLAACIARLYRKCAAFMKYRVHISPSHVPNARCTSAAQRIDSMGAICVISQY